MGATVNNYLMQLQADILGVKIIRPVLTETTSLGAAYAAGLAADFWKDLNEIKQNWRIDRVFIPQWTEEKREKLYKGWRKAVKRSMRWIEK